MGWLGCEIHTFVRMVEVTRLYYYLDTPLLFVAWMELHGVHIWPSTALLYSGSKSK